MKFSITIPAYKSFFLKECVDSILKQTYDDFELIIVNDASPEDIDSIVECYSDKRINYYKNKINTGAQDVVDNWNICLSYAKGEYLILMGDDDKMMPDYLEKFLQLIHRYPFLDVYHCRSYIIDEYSRIVGCTPSWPEYESMVENMYHRMKGYRKQYISDFVFRRDTLKKNGGFYKTYLAWSSDDITSFIAARNKGIAHLQKPVFCYRDNNQTITSTGSTKLKLTAIEQEEKWYTEFLNETVYNTQIENLFKDLIIKYKETYFKIKRKKTIIQSSKLNVFQILYWFRHRNKYNLSTTDIVQVLLMRLKVKYLS